NRSTLEDVGVKSIRFGTSATVQSILAVPMRLGERVVGMMSAQSYQPDAYNLEDQQLLEMLAAYAAVAIANVRLYYQLEERLREAEFINRVATLLGETRSITDMVTQVLEETKFFLRGIATAAWVFDSERRNLQLISASGWLKSISVDLNGEHSLVNLAFQTGEILSCQNLRADEHVPAIWRDLLPEEQGAACVPIRTLGEIVGVLMLTFEVGRELSRTEERALKIIAEMVGGAVRRAQLDEQMQRQLQRLASLRVIDMAINTILDLRVILNILLEHIASQLGADAACVMLLNPKTQILSHAASIGFRSEGVRNWQTHLGVDITSRPVRLRSLLFIPDLRETTRFGRLSVLLVDQFVSYACMPLIAKGEVKGVLELFYRTRIEPTSEWKNFLEIVAEQTALAIDNAQLFEELQKSNADLSLAYDAAIEIWSKVMDLRSHEVEGHTRRLADLTVRIATFMGVPESEMPQIRRGALLHDVGMMSVPDQILDKPGPLTEEEWGIIRQHPRKAYEILSPIPQLRVALDIPYCHHERWDGSGYPRGISGKQIPLAARIFAVVDVWDALLSDRPYRKAWSKEAALRYILENSGVLFDPAVVEAFLKIITSSEET
ncbi:MAG: GAF domain-containing protein, partial [Anaerolineales bacterium]|nr:GAF domain-containing protein [Anaerolineales bacterium]